MMERNVSLARERMNNYLREGQSARAVVDQIREDEHEVTVEAFNGLFTNTRERKRALKAWHDSRAIVVRDDYLAEIQPCLGGSDQRKSHAELQAAILVHQITYIGHSDFLPDLKTSRHEAVHQVRDLLLGLSPRGTRHGPRKADLSLARALVELRVPLTGKSIQIYTSYPTKKRR